MSAFPTSRSQQKYNNVWYHITGVSQQILIRDCFVGACNEYITLLNIFIQNVYEKILTLLRSMSQKSDND
jgi:hypothetical protein